MGCSKCRQRSNKICYAAFATWVHCAHVTLTLRPPGTLLDLLSRRAVARPALPVPGGLRVRRHNIFYCKLLCVISVGAVDGERDRLI